MRNADWVRDRRSQGRGNFVECEELAPASGELWWRRKAPASRSHSKRFATTEAGMDFRGWRAHAVRRVVVRLL